MNTEELKKFEESLLALRDQLSHEIKDLIVGADMGNDAGDDDEEVDKAEEAGIASAEALVFKERLHQVLDALERMKAGTYGTCESCGGAIGYDVLEVDPESRECKVCKAKR